MSAIRSVTVTKVGTAIQPTRDSAAAEEPLEIRLHGKPFVTIMRTPGRDRDLAAGFLVAERVIDGPDDLATIQHCTDPDADDWENVLNVTLAEPAAARAQALQPSPRAVASGSSCGVCGRRTIDDLMGRIKPIACRWRVSRSVIERLPTALRAHQTIFAETGGLHAAGLFDPQGVCVASAEDVGRHNAVDKVIGAELLLERLPLHHGLLFVSGRTSFEIIQKAAVAGIPLVASVSAPSSLAIELASDAGITLIGFVREGSFNVYTGIERVDF